MLNAFVIKANKKYQELLAKLNELSQDENNKYFGMAILGKMHGVDDDKIIETIIGLIH